MTLDSWITFREKEGWRMGGEQLKIGEIYGKWERLEELSNQRQLIL